MKRRGTNRVAQRNLPAPHRIDQPRRRRCYFRSRFANARRGCHNGNTHPAYCAPPTLTTCQQCYCIQVQAARKAGPVPCRTRSLPLSELLGVGAVTVPRWSVGGGGNWRMARRNAEVLSPRSAPGFLVWDPEMPGHRTCQRLGGGADSAAPARAVWPPTYFMARCDRSAVSSGLHTYKSHPRGPMLHV